MADTNRKETRSALWALVRLLPTFTLTYTILATLAIIGSSLIGVLFTILSGALVGAVPGAIANGFDSPAGQHLQMMFIAVGVLFVLTQVLDPFTEVLTWEVGRRANITLRTRVLKASLDPPGISHLEDPDLLDKISRAKEIGPSGITPSDAVLGLAGLFRMHLSGLFSMVVVARFNVVIAVILGVTWAISRRRLRRDFLETIKLIVGGTQRLRRANYIRGLGLLPSAAKELRVFGMREWLGALFTDTWTRTMSSVWTERRAHRRALFVIASMIGIVHLGAFAVIGRAALAGHLDIGQFMIASSAMFGIGTLGSISNFDYQLEYGATAVPAAMELEQAVRERDGAMPGTKSPAGMPAREIRFEEVSFCYPHQQRAVLDGLSLAIPAGRSLAIVGENGAGKTTLVKLLARLYDPTSGHITADGVDLRSLQPRSWQRRIGAIFQDFVKYPLSVTDNVGFGALERLSDRAALQEAARLAGALPVIEGLRHDWDTILNRRYTDGADLSGGEWQRVALARAMLAVRAGAGILVLDEPTANLDVRAEAEIYDRFLELTEGLTTIVISHRFSTVRRADRIVVLEHGRITEDGTHDELMAADGRYAYMFGLQAARFTEQVPVSQDQSGA